MACDAINLGKVAIGYYEQNKFDKLLGLNTDEEFVALVAPVGRYRKEKPLAEFFKYPKKEVAPEGFRKLEGKYKRKSLVEFLVRGSELVIKIGEFEEALEPYNEMEFIGNYSA